MESKIEKNDYVFSIYIRTTAKNSKEQQRKAKNSKEQQRKAKNSKEQQRTAKNSKEQQRTAKNNKMQSDFIKVHTCGAVYNLSDSMYFDVLQKIGDQCYLNIHIETEEGDIQLLYSWDKIPQVVLQIYEYVDKKSFMSENNIVYGCHINRTDSNIFALRKFQENPIGKYVTICDKDMSVYDDNFFHTRWRNLKRVKNIE